LLQHHDGWRPSWTHIVPGIFGNSGRTGLLLYDQAAGFGAFYDTDGQGGIGFPLQEHSNWRTSWTHILAGRFLKGSKYSAVLFYEQSTGFAEIYATDGSGGIECAAQYDNWRTSWTQIVAGEFVNSNDWSEKPVDDLFFFEGSTRYGEIHES